MADAQPAPELSWAEASVHFVKNPGVDVEVEVLGYIRSDAGDYFEWCTTGRVFTSIYGDIHNLDGVVEDEVPEANGDVIFVKESVETTLDLADTALRRVFVRATGV